MNILGGAKGSLLDIDKHFKLNPVSIVPPNFYFGSIILMVEFSNEINACVVSLIKYIQEYIRNVGRKSLIEGNK